MSKLFVTVVLPPSEARPQVDGGELAVKADENLEFLADEVQYLASGIVIKSEDELTGASTETFLPYGEFIMVEIFKAGENKGETFDDVPV